MINNKLINQFKQIRKDIVFENEVLSNHTSYKIGGKCAVMLRPKTLEEIIKIINILHDKNVKYFVLGKGTNILADDDGYSGVVINMTDYNLCYRFENNIIAYGGASLNRVCSLASKNSLSGMEEAYGIPGSVGGAIFMNAGAFQFETKKVVGSVLALVNGKIKLFNNKECEFGYRKSIFQSKKNVIILQVEFLLDVGEKEKIQHIMRDTMKKRLSSQPYSYPSAGSVFKRPEGHYIGRLIEKAGFKGHCVGGACVSELHANFIINKQNATASDVITIIKDVKQKILLEHGISLITEIRYLGDKDDIW